MPTRWCEPAAVQPEFLGGMQAEEMHTTPNVKCRETMGARQSTDSDHSSGIILQAKVEPKVGFLEYLKSSPGIEWYRSRRVSRASPPGRGSLLV